RAGEDRGGSARLHPDPAVEPQGGDRDAAGVRTRVGCAVHRPDSAGGSAVKVLLSYGAQGMRMREASEHIPKPMIPVGHRPILWHVMKYYAHHGFNDF